MFAARGTTGEGGGCTGPPGGAPGAQLGPTQTEASVSLKGLPLGEDS